MRAADAARRQPAMNDRTYRFGEFTLGTLARELRHGDTPVALSPRAFDCLVHLIEHRERAVGKDELIAAIWKRNNVSDTQLGQTVLLARRALGDDGHSQQYIRTVSRYGYRWVGAIDESAPHAEAANAAAPTTLPDIMPTGATAATSATDTEAHAPSRGARPRRFVAAIALAVLVLVAASLAWFHSRHASNWTGAEALALPLRVEAPADEAWLRLGGMDLVAERLRGGGLTVPPSDNVVALLRDVAPGQEAATLRRAAPTALLVDGALTRKDDAWSVELRATTPDGAVLEVEAARDEPLAALREAADRLLARLGHARPVTSAIAPGAEERLQRARAALLANDLAGARALLAADPEATRDEPQLAYRLVQIDFRAGAYAHAETSLDALLADPAAREPLFRARLLNGRGAVRLRLENYAGAEADYDAAIVLLGDGAHAPELGLALTGRGIVRSMRHDAESAAADFAAARVQLEAAGDELGVARVDSNLGGLEMNRDRPQQALAPLERAATQFERYGAINELFETLTSLVSDHLALLEPAQALAASDRAWALAARATDPNQDLALRLDRVDVFLALGRLREAAALLADLPDAASAAPPYLARRLPTLRARLAFATHRDAEAAEWAARALALPPPSDDAGEGIAEIALLRERALAANDSSAAARADGASTANEVPRYPVQAVLAAEIAQAHGDTAGAARSYRTALDLAERRGVPADLALVAGSYGPWLLARGELGEAAAVIGRVSPQADHDFDCALLELRLFHALGRGDAWQRALARAQALAGERELPPALRTPP